MLKSLGMVRKIDEMGRIVIPKELRKNLGMESGDAFEIYTDEDSIVLKPYIPADIFTGEMENLVEYNGKKVSVNTIKELARRAGLKISE